MAEGEERLYTESDAPDVENDAATNQMDRRDALQKRYSAHAET